MSNRWMRFNYMDPIPQIDTQTGLKTGKLICYLRAVRSDCFLYCVHTEIKDGSLSKEDMYLVHAELRRTLDTFLEDVPHVEPMENNEAYKGMKNWMEALIH